MTTANLSTAPGWEKWADWTLEQEKPVVDWLCRSAGLAPAMTVLDVACGAGQPAIQAAAVVGSGGRVIATDVAADMLAGCQRRARAAGVENLELRELDMHDLRTVGDASIDAVTFGFALMFSSDPVRVMSEIRRVLKPGGRFALCVWDERAKNPFFTTMFGAMAEVAPQPPPPADAPGPFKLAAPGDLERVIRAGGFIEVAVEPVPFVFEFESVEQHWEINRDMAAPLKRAAATLPTADVARLRSVLADALAPYTEGGRVRLLATALCATGRR
jgi:SAM-dependent methyltransferase